MIRNTQKVEQKEQKEEETISVYQLHDDTYQLLHMKRVPYDMCEQTLIRSV